MTTRACINCSFFNNPYQHQFGTCRLHPPQRTREWPETAPYDFCGQFQPKHREGGFCRKGHELTQDNVLYKKNSTSRQCKLCHKIAQETRRGKL